MRTSEYYGELPKRITRNSILMMAIESIVNDIVGGLENIMNDNPEESTEYKEAEQDLENYEKLINTIYKELLELEFIQTGFGRGFETKNYLKFEGKEEIVKRIEEKLNEYGYYRKGE